MLAKAMGCEDDYGTGSIPGLFTGETKMAKKYNLKDAGLSALMIQVLNDRAPALNELFIAVTDAARIEKGATDARKDANAELKAYGLDGDNLFGQVKKVACELAFVDNGDGNERGIAGVTVMQYFHGRSQAEGLPENTGKAYARLCGQTVEALRAGDVDVETVTNWTRPDAQAFFASDDAAARSKVKATVATMLNGCTAGYAEQVLEHLATFRYERPEDAKPGSAEWLGRKPKKEAKPADAGG